MSEYELCRFCSCTVKSDGTCRCDPSPEVKAARIHAELMLLTNAHHGYLNRNDAEAMGWLPNVKARTPRTRRVL